ncbi:MAG TPA: hypothetical protein VMU27_01420 [Candidatus Paceibacterota bacterium]|nr:hypothetical protein [Candidatus Paceibacterota bacterium]
MDRIDNSAVRQGVPQKRSSMARTMAEALVLIFATVRVASAQSVSVDSLITKFGVYIIDPILLVIFAAGFFMFMWGLFQFMLNVNRGEDTSAGKQHMIYGTIGMVIMVSVYGIIGLLDNTFGLNISHPNTDTQNVNVPSVTFTGS